MRKPTRNKSKTTPPKTSKDTLKETGLQRSRATDQPTPPSRQPSLWVWIQRRWKSIILAISLLANVYQLSGGPPWPVDPELHFRDTSDGSSLILPFSIRNRSGIFDMPSVKFRCGIDLVIAHDAKNQTVIIRDAAFLNGTASINAGYEISYRCNAADLQKIRSDGSLSLYSSGTILYNRRNILYQAPWIIDKMCVWVGGEYRVSNILPWSFTSQIFEWPAEPGSHQWQEGRVTGKEYPEAEIERREGLIPGALQCSEAVQSMYMLVNGTGPALLVLPPDKMGGLGFTPLPPSL